MPVTSIIILICMILTNFVSTFEVCKHFLKNGNKRNLGISFKFKWEFAHIVMVRLDGEGQGMPSPFEQVGCFDDPNPSNYVAGEPYYYSSLSQTNKCLEIIKASRFYWSLILRF